MITANRILNGGCNPANGVTFLSVAIALIFFRPAADRLRCDRYVSKGDVSRLKSQDVMGSLKIRPKPSRFDHNYIGLYYVCSHSHSYGPNIF